MKCNHVWQTVQQCFECDMIREFMPEQELVMDADRQCPQDEPRSESEVMKLVLTQLRDKMEQKGINIEELAMKALMSSRTIEKARSAKIGLPLNTCKRIAHAMKTKLEELL